MAESRDLSLRKAAAAALLIEYLLLHPLSAADSGLINDPGISQSSSTNGQGGAAQEETTEQEEADSAEVKGDLRRLTDQQER